MKTLISRSHQSLPVILVVLFLAFAAAAQSTLPASQTSSYDFQVNWAEGSGGTNQRPAAPGFIQNSAVPQVGANFNITGNGNADIFNVKTQFNTENIRVLMADRGLNLFVGRNAGRDPLGGFNNSFIGSFAGSGNVSGNLNVFVGFESGRSNIKGSSNSFVGARAGSSNTSGEENSFFGAGAGSSNTTGNINSFFGLNAGFNNKTGRGNSFFGTSAGLSNVTGQANSFVGVSAGRSNTTGGDNSFFGVNAGTSNKTGSQNTIIGSFADVTVSNLNHATAIGAEAKVSTSNTIVLGRGDGSDKVRIFGLGAGGLEQLCRNGDNEIATCSSSLRYKTNVAQFSSGLNLLRRLQPIRFEWKDGGMKDIGFGAEDVAAVEPLLVNYNAKGEIEGVKYDRLTTVLVNAVKEQQTQIEAQRQQLKQQQTQIDGLKKILCGQNPDAEICKQ